MRPQFQKEKIYIYGKHALEEALLHAPHVVKKVFLAADANDGELRRLVAKNDIPISVLKTREVDRMVGADTSHQGVVAITDPSALLISFDDFAGHLAPSAEGGPRQAGRTSNLEPASTMLVLLDELTDPHNVGAIIRSAAAFGAAGVLMPSHNQAPITGAVVKASAGMAFRVPLVSIGNINFTIDSLKKMDFKTYALVMDGKKNVAHEKFESPTLLIVGNEGYGIRQKTLERCDVTLRIPMSPRCESLNASVSAAIVLHQWSTQHPEALK
jgi:23S rRNA (guanosine2251-2'-O)-methyltransferase